MLMTVQAHMKEAGQTFARMLGSKVSSRAPAIPMFSSQTNNVIRSKNAVNGPYWQSSYDNPVLFNTVLQKLILSRSVNAAPLMLVEIGPHSALAGPIRQIIKECQRDVSCIPTLVRGEHSMTTRPKPPWLSTPFLHVYVFNSRRNDGSSVKSRGCPF